MTTLIQSLKQTLSHFHEASLFFTFRDSVMAKPALLRCTLSSACIDVWITTTHTYTHTQTHTHTQCTHRTQPWQSFGHSVCLIFSLAPLPSWEHSWHPEAQRGSSSGLKAVSHFRAGTSSRYQLSIPLFLLFGPKRPAYPPFLSGGSFHGEWPLWGMVWFLSGEILLALSFPALRLRLELCPSSHPRMWIGRGHN